ncbi:MAG: MBL fold metallo-hydrolase [Candidatus Spechtbacterales bacterium]
MPRLTFHGGALSVTGANYLIETKKSKVLVDCGMIQGGKHCDDANYKPFAYDASKIDAVFVTHAHIDHTGRLPKLIKEGFRGKIFATAPTAELAALMLDDSQEIVEDQCGPELGALYSKKDVTTTENAFEPVVYGGVTTVTEDIAVRFMDAGHILGSAIVEIFIQEGNDKTKLVFSGDLGNPPTPLLDHFAYIRDADYVITESTYGDRLHEDKAVRKSLLENAIEDTVTRGGVLMIPSFALERTQEILFELNELVENKRIPETPIFLDSPLAIKATEVYRKHTSFFNESALSLIAAGDKLFDFPRLKLTMRTEESKAINEVPAPKLIIAGSGMSTGGRILHHEKHYLPDPKSMLLFIGYQAEGTLGRRILEGEQEVSIMGDTVPVRAEIRAIGGYSAHADQNTLLEWVRVIRDGGGMKRVFCVQGEEQAANALAVKLRDTMAVNTVVPRLGDAVEL